ncbi:hypothetical protein K9B35_11155 [Sphingomonas sp. R647]|uniref:hypothetical protein n=1 Tax=Sphingomonas sp. R647 TaxID=2875233 RepID=UPI001CD330A0|nr:hypothetical protein [Sphingomonas sp. R647]MCA1198529.1 hypothetical protein [Sphingomonas sp. R647]
MSEFTVDGRAFTLVRGSDIDRDGMYLELSEAGGRSGIAELFYSDAHRNFVLSTFGDDIPLEAIEMLIAQGRKSLPAKSA